MSTRCEYEEMMFKGQGDVKVELTRELLFSANRQQLQAHISRLPNKLKKKKISKSHAFLQVVDTAYKFSK